MTNFNDISTLKSSFELILILGNVLILVVLIYDFLIWFVSNFIEINLLYGWNDLNDSSIWDEECTEAYEPIQSPGFVIKNAIELPTKPLIWSRKYKRLPTDVQIVNKNSYLLLKMKYLRSPPSISGGPLDSTYTLQQILFKWRPNKGGTTESASGTEEFILEMQAIHIKRESVSEENMSENIICNRENNAAVIINYVIEVSDTSNFAFQEMISKFDMIQEPDSNCDLLPLPMSWLLPTFPNYYYISQESTPHSYFTKGLQWIISPIKLSISKQQMIQFQQFLNPNCSEEMSETNTELDNKEIFYCFEMEAEIK